MKEWLKKAFSSSGDVSIMRILAVAIVFNEMAVWTYTCISKGEMVDMAAGNVSVIGLVILGKGLQSFGESRNQS